MISCQKQAEDQGEPEQNSRNENEHSIIHDTLVR